MRSTEFVYIQPPSCTPFQGVSNQSIGITTTSLMSNLIVVIKLWFLFLLVIENQDEVIASKLLALKANKDSEFCINKKGIGDNAGMKGLAAVGSLAYASIFPTTSVMINWHQKQSKKIKILGVLPTHSL